MSIRAIVLEYGDTYKDEFEVVEEALDWKDGKAVTEVFIG